MRHSHLEKIDEEGNSALDDSANPFSNNRTIYLNQQTEELSRDALKSQTSIENHLTGSNIFRSTTTPAMNIESKLRATQRLSKTRGSRIEIVNSQKEMKSLKSRISFYKGKPRTEEDIIKLDCPLYRCQTNTIIRSNIKKEFLFEESKGNYDNPKDISGNKSVNKTEENVSEPKGKLSKK